MLWLHLLIHIFIVLNMEVKYMHTFMYPTTVINTRQKLSLLINITPHSWNTQILPSTSVQFFIDKMQSHHGKFYDVSRSTAKNLLHLG